ncbi:hypothetical protein BHE74_00044757 [Ensete ventricosum]|nr:hypothetical protein BHE74_00044757 [Ensete ventricosum]
MAIVDSGSPPIDPDPMACTVIFGKSTYVARSLVTALVKSGRWAVRVADTLAPPLGLIQSDLAAYFHVDVADRSSLRSAVAGSAVVFLVDPLPAFPSPPVGGDFPRLHALAVVGAKNVVAACREAGVLRLVYTGSADVVFDGKNDIRGADESLPYPRRVLGFAVLAQYEDPLNELRMQAEVLVLSANGKDGLLTCALRPGNIFGPGDPHLVPFLVQEAISKRAKVWIVCVTSPYWGLTNRRYGTYRGVSIDHMSVHLGVPSV